MAWYNRSGKKTTTIDGGTFQDAHISPDGKKVSAARADAGGHLEIYIYDLGRGNKSQFSFSQTGDDDLIWSPDGNTIVFDSGRNGKIDLYTRPVSGARQEELLYHDDLDKYPSGWSADGKYITYEAIANGHYDVWVLPMLGDRRPNVFLQEKYNTRYPSFSPDTKWMAFTEIDRRPPGTCLPVWGRLRRKPGHDRTRTTRLEPQRQEVLYLDDHSRISSVEVTAHGDSVELGKPKILFPVQSSNQFEVSPDGQRLLMIQAPVQDSSSLTLIVNWPQELKK